jgi:hypothetical protein
MKKVLALLALTLTIAGLTGCLDPQDGEKQRPGTASSISL